MQIEFVYARRAWQKEAAKQMAKHRFSVIVAHRRAGKTVEVLVQLMERALTCTMPDPRFAYLAPYHIQAKSIAWTYLKKFSSQIPGTKINESELSVTLPNMAVIRLFGADRPDALRGMYFDGVVLDEVANMRPELWGEVLRPALADRKGSAIFIGTPAGINLFYDIYHHAVKDPEWYAEIFPVQKTDALDQAEVEAARMSMSENQFRQEFECDFSAANTDTLIPLTDIEEARGRLLNEENYSFAPKILGVDVARFGDDKSVIIRRQGAKAWEPIILRDMDLMATATTVSHEIMDWTPTAVFIDETGLGSGVVDRLRQLNYDVIGVNFGSRADDKDRFFNKRSEMWTRLRDWIQAGGSIPNNVELVSDLATVEYTHDPRERIKLEPKDNIKKRGLPSPDIADALACTFFSSVQADEPSRFFSQSEQDWRTVTGMDNQSGAVCIA